SAGLYAPPAGKFEKTWWCLDQALLSMTLDRHGITPWLLDSTWNHGYIADNFWTGMPDANFIHLNGSRPHDYRMQLLRRICSGNYDRMDPPKQANWRPRWAA